MALINMKRPKPKKRAKEMLTAPEPYWEKYPYGLKIDLHNEELNRYNFSEGDIKIRDKLLKENTSIL